MKKHLYWVFALVASISLMGCAGSTIGDGKVDTVEAATIQVAVGVAMAQNPKLIAPSYAVSAALLTGIDANALSTPELLEKAIGKEIDKLNLDALTKQSALDLVVLIKAKIMQELGPIESTGTKMVVLKQIVQIVYNTAALRITTK